MTLAKTGSEVLTKEEWNELIALKEAITYAPQTVSAQKMEKFAELMVRSLEGKSLTFHNKINTIITIQNYGKHRPTHSKG